LRPSLQIPAMLSTLPLGFASSVMRPSRSQYLNNTWSLSSRRFSVSSAAW
jgi:hypothetical protein